MPSDQETACAKQALRSRRPRDSARLVDKQVMYEPGAVNALGEYKLWLHVWGYDHHSRQDISSGIYPWPFASKTIDPELLAAWGSLTHFKNFPGRWPMFMGHWSVYTFLPGDMNRTAKYYWLLANGTGKQHVSKFGLSLTDPVIMLPYQIPEVFLKCIC